MSELVDEHDLGSCAARRGSSSLPFPRYILELFALLNILLAQDIIPCHTNGKPFGFMSVYILGGSYGHLT